DIAGFEFGCKDDGSCTPPNSPPLTSKADGCGQMKWFYSKGMNTFRLPIGWQYATPTLGGSFDPTMWGSYDKLVQCCLSLPGAYCVVDVHNWARWNGAVIGQSMSDAPYIKLWQMIATQYASEPRVIFGLMNEPWKLNLSAWATTLQRVVNAVRPIAPRHVILLPGIEFAHADTFISSGTATTLDAITNPDGTKNNLLFDLHQWLDKGNLGTSSVCVTNNIAVFTPVVNWLRCNKRKAFLSATGGGNAASDNCMSFMCQQMSYLFSNSDVIVGYTGWAAGSYDTTYIYDETPTWLGSPWSDTPLVASCMYWP
ncbi:glycoside hydrolase family 5 protein, partial [Tulasnella calospora MUT 4182]